MELEHTLACTNYGAWFITHSKYEACWTHKLWPLHIASPANHHIDIEFWRRNGDGSSINRRIKRQIYIFDVISLWDAICVPIVLHVRFFLISVTKLWDMVMYLCMCKGRMHHTKGLGTKSRCKMANTCNYCLPITVKWESKSYINDKMEKQIFSEWCHKCHRISSQCSIRIWLHDDHHAAFTHVSNCIPLRTDLVRMAEIFEIAYGTSWISRRRSWMQKVRKSSYIYQKLVKWSTWRKLPAESAGR